MLIGEEEKAWDILFHNHKSNGGEFRDDPHSSNPDMSHDNYTGIMCANKMFKFGFPVQIFSRKRVHPRDLIFYGYLKYPWLFYWLLWIPSIAMIVSCMRTWKIRGPQKFIATDGKLLAYFRCISANMGITFLICTWILKRKEYFGGWEVVFLRYFRDPEHPICRVATSSSSFLEDQLSVGYSFYLHLIGIVSIGLVVFEWIL